MNVPSRVSGNAMTWTVTLVAALLAGGLASPAQAQMAPEDITALQQQAEREGWTFTVGQNEATDLPFEVLCGAVEPKDWQEEGPWDPCTPQRDLPEFFDWRDYDGCTPVRSQSPCGSCWAHAAIGATESMIRITTGAIVDLSEQWLISCTPAGTCNSGGWPTMAFRYLRCDCGGYVDDCGDCGAVLNADEPWQYGDGPCHCPYDHPYCIPGYTYIGSAYGVPPVANMKQALLDHGPIIANVHAGYGAFSAYNGGVFNACEDGSIDHSIVLVGWDDRLGSDGVWIMRNSWGSGWGDGGYMYIEYDCSRIGYGAAYITYTPPIHCIASSNQTEYEYISNVAIEYFQNPSGSAGFDDQTDEIIELARGADYPATITLTNAHAGDRGGLWIDWNRDLDFEDAYETITESWTGAGPYTTTITPPGSALLGLTRMRVRVQDGGFDPVVEACDTTDRGEVEDYTINVVTASSDTAAPAPDPMTFASPPAPYINEVFITMTATTAIETESPPVRYEFDFVSGGPGGVDSVWQTSPTFIVGGLAANTEYVYRVRARDDANPSNVSDFSAPAAGATFIETPTGIAAGAVTASSIGLTATGSLTNLATGSSGVYFDCLTGGGDGGINGWVQSTSDTATGLTPDTSYEFCVKARNQGGHETEFTTAVSATTLANVAGAPLLGLVECGEISLDVMPNGNPATTRYAIQCISTSPYDATWNGRWLSFFGTPLTSPEWITDADWGVQTLTNLDPGTTYTFRVTARNQDQIPSAAGASAAITVSVCGDGDMDGDGDLDLTDFQSWQTCFEVLPVSTECAPADFEGNGYVDLTDFAEFATALSGP